MIMSEEKFSDLFQPKEVKRSALKPGDRVQAMVVAVNKDSVFLDVGQKSEGVLDAKELINDDGEVAVEVGDQLGCFFLASRAGELRFTTKLGSSHASAQELEDAFHSGIPVEGKVEKEIKGGFSVTIAGMRCFCPYSQMDIRRIEDPESYIGQTLSFKIREFSQGGRNIIISARALIEEQRELEKEKLRESLSEGMQVTGTVSSIRDFGAFVDLGGVDGLIPISELAWGQTDRVEDVVHQGQVVEVVIKRLDWETERISLSLKETLPDPWDSILETFPTGSVHIARVSRLQPFGAFITLTEGIDGLLHISKIGGGRKINHPREALEAGQEITVTIESVDKEKKRISLVPDDYTPEEQEEEIRYTPPPEDKKQSMGTLGDLLKAQMKK